MECRVECRVGRPRGGRVQRARVFAGVAGAWRCVDENVARERARRVPARCRLAQICVAGAPEAVPRRRNLAWVARQVAESDSRIDGTDAPSRWYFSSGGSSSGGTLLIALSADIFTPTLPTF